MTPESIPGRLIPEGLELGVVLPLRIDDGVEREEEQKLLELREAA